MPWLTLAAVACTSVLRSAPRFTRCRTHDRAAGDRGVRAVPAFRSHRGLTHLSVLAEVEVKVNAASGSGAAGSGRGGAELAARLRRPLVGLRQFARASALSSRIRLEQLFARASIFTSSSTPAPPRSPAL
jgi:hypothetical protein